MGHQSRINFQPPFVGTGFRPHSDSETWMSEDGLPGQRACSAVVFLEENRPQNGALMVIPGSHKRFITVAGETPENNWESSLVTQVAGSPHPTCIEQVWEECG